MIPETNMQIPESKLETVRGKVITDSEIDSSFVDSPSPSEGPDKILDASLASFPPGYFDCLFGGKLMSKLEVN